MACQGCLKPLVSASTLHCPRFPSYLQQMFSSAFTRYSFSVTKPWATACRCSVVANYLPCCSSKYARNHYCFSCPAWPDWSFASGCYHEWQRSSASQTIKSVYSSFHLSFHCFHQLVSGHCSDCRRLSYPQRTGPLKSPRPTHQHPKLASSAVRRPVVASTASKVFGVPLLGW